MSIDLIQRHAALQDALLQSYRGYLFTTQAILLGVGIGLCIASVFVISSIGLIVTSVLLFAVFLLAIFTGLKFRQVILSRQKDVDYWQRQLIECEQKLQPEDRAMTIFKIHQKTHRREMTHQELFEKLNDEAFIKALIQKGKGHTRTVIDGYLPLAFLLVWIIVLIIQLLMIFTISQY
jgi:hypothetical protein